MFELLLNTYLYYGGLLFTIEFLLCTAVFCFRLPRRRKFILRLVASVAGIFAASFALSSLFIIESGSVSYIIRQLLYYLLLEICFNAGIFICFDVRLSVAIITGIGCYATQHLGYSIFNLVLYAVAGTNVLGIWLIPAESAFCAVVAAAVYFLLLKDTDFYSNTYGKDPRLLPISASAILSCIVLNSVALSLLDRNSPILMFVIRPYAILSCILLLLIVFGFSREMSLKREKEMVDVLLHYEKEQHKIRSESMDLIHMKCHDLKHQLSLLKSTDNRAAYDEIYHEINAAINGFSDTSIKTGNDALDLILSEQSIRCRDLGIYTDFRADGTKLSFMKDSDVSALFGNGLDNAVEAVRKRGGGEISLTVKNEADTVFIQIENDCDEVTFRDGMPVTDKSDKRYHGFGVKSIFHIVGHYGGTAKVYLKGGKFVLDILFLPKKRPNKQKK